MARQLVDAFTREQCARGDGVPERVHRRQYSAPNFDRSAVGVHLMKDREG